MQLYEGLSVFVVSFFLAINFITAFFGTFMSQLGQQQAGQYHNIFNFCFYMIKMFIELEALKSKG
jgi:hypothetical protein